MKRTALYLTIAFLLAACAAPASDQGQGGSNGPLPQNVTNIVFHGDVNVTQTGAPAAAPSSAASASQTATTDVKPNVEIPASAIPTLGEAIIPAVTPAPETPR